MKGEPRYGVKNIYAGSHGPGHMGFLQYLIRFDNNWYLFELL